MLRLIFVQFTFLFLIFRNFTLFFIDINKYMKAQVSQTLTAHSIFHSKRFSQSTQSSPNKQIKEQLTVNNRPIPLHIIRRNKIQQIRRQAEQPPQFWGCIIPQKYKSKRNANSVQLITKQTQIHHNFDRSHLLYSKFLKAKPVRILIRSSTSRNHRKTHEVISARPGTTISRNQPRLSNISKEMIDFNPKSTWENGVQSQVMKKYSSTQRQTSESNKIRSKIKIRANILDFLQRGMRAISNGEEIDLNYING